MFTQFRSRYPTGAIVSELIAIDKNQYIVRVLVQVAGATLSSGLAMADTVELAEDKARERSLKFLGLGQMTEPLPKADLPKLETPLPEAKSAQVHESIDPPLEHQPTETPKMESIAMSSDHWLSSANYVQPKTEFSPSQDSPTEEPRATVKGRGASLPHLPINEQEASENTMRPQQEQLSVTATPTTSSITDHDDDLSSDIAKTDIELRRLGWSAEQGAAYLLKAYGKRSRRNLSPEELLDFLHYLECLPTP